jgi:hypothetical protein
LRRDDVDLRRGFVLPRLEAGRFRALVAFRLGFLLALGRDVFLVRFGAGFRTRAAVFFRAGLSRRSPAAFPAIAPTIPPTTAPVGPIMLPSAAPATAPAVSFGIGGTSMFSASSFFCAFKSSAITATPCFDDYRFMYFVRRVRDSRGKRKRRPIKRPPFRKINLDRGDELTSAALSTAVAATIPTVTASTRWARFARSRFIYGESAPFQLCAVNFGNGLLGILVGAHSHKGESARFSSEFVLHQHDFLDRARFGKKLLKFVFGRVKWEISHV